MPPTSEIRSNAVRPAIVPTCCKCGRLLIDPADVKEVRVGSYPVRLTCFDCSVHISAYVVCRNELAGLTV